MYFYKPHIRITFYANINTKDEANLFPPIVVNKYPDDLEITCTIDRDALTGNFAMKCLVDIVNLNTYTKWQLINHRYQYIEVCAGYLGTDYYSQDDKDTYIQSKLKVLFRGPILWVGTIVEARKKVTTRFLSVQNYAQSLDASLQALSIRYNAGYNLYQLIRDAVGLVYNTDAKLNLNEKDKEQLITTTVVYDSNNIKSIEDILNLYSITITEGYDMNEGQTVQSYLQMNSEASPPVEDQSQGEVNVVDVNENTGLINIPTLQSSGDYPTLRFTMMFDYRVKLFNYVKIENADVQLPVLEDIEDVTKLNYGQYLDAEVVGDTITGKGFYLVKKITYSLESRGGNFTQEIEASPYDIYNQIIVKNREKLEAQANAEETDEGSESEEE